MAAHPRRSRIGLQKAVELVMQEGSDIDIDLHVSGNESFYDSDDDFVLAADEMRDSDSESGNVSGGDVNEHV